jgi:hypothetical protein
MEKTRFYRFIYQREYFNPSRFGANRYKKIKASSLEEACGKMLNHMGQWFNIGCKDYAYDDAGNELDLSEIDCIQHMLICD